MSVWYVLKYWQTHIQPRVEEYYVSPDTQNCILTIGSTNWKFLILMPKRRESAQAKNLRVRQENCWKSDRAKVNSTAKTTEMAATHRGNPTGRNKEFHFFYVQNKTLKKSNICWFFSIAPVDIFIMVHSIESLVDSNAYHFVTLKFLLLKIFKIGDKNLSLYIGPILGDR